MKEPTTEQELEAAINKLTKAQNKHGFDNDRQKKIDRYKVELEKIQNP